MNPNEHQYDELSWDSLARPNGIGGLPIQRVKGIRRRTFLKATTAVATGVALGALDLLPMTKPRIARAYTQYYNCTSAEYYSSSTTCSPSWNYMGGDNCSVSWHRAGTVWLSPDVVATYTHHPYRCDGKNAWRWYQGSSYTKCSDGHKYSYDHSIDSVQVNSNSICRTYG